MNELALSLASLTRHWPEARHSLVDGMAATSAAVFAKYGIATAPEAADFMAQISEETGGGTVIEENLNYTAARLCQVWPSRFPTLAAALPFSHNPHALADRVYGNLYGNRAGTDDGYNFRGRSGIQITFRDWYAKISSVTGLDLVSTPDLANDPQHFLECSAAFWKLDGVNVFADSGNFIREVERVNGGLVNLPARLQWRAIWRHEFGL